MKNAFIFQTARIPKNSKFFKELNNQEIFYHHFQVEDKYYLFIFAKKIISIEFLSPFPDVTLIKKLDSKEREIRSLRGLLNYLLLDLKVEAGKVLASNLIPFFWTDIERVLRQRKKDAITQYLFGTTSQQENQNMDIKNMNIKIQELEKIIDELKSAVQLLKKSKK